MISTEICYGILPTVRRVYFLLCVGEKIDSEANKYPTRESNLKKHEKVSDCKLHMMMHEIHNDAVVKDMLLHIRRFAYDQVQNIRMERLKYVNVCRFVSTYIKCYH